MIRIRKSSDRGRFRSDWLDARFSFSFGSYRDPAHDGYSDLLVLNDDRVAPGAGFAMHPHADIEVMSYPMAGTIEHCDSLGHRALMRPGDVHLMRAGTGICHSEMNASTVEPEHHLQWWIRPSAAGLPPAYAHMHVAAGEKLNQWRVLAAPGGATGSLALAQDARVLAAVVEGSALVYIPPARRLSYLHVVRGDVTLNGLLLANADAAFVEQEPAIVLTAPAGRSAEVLLFDLREM
jgi:redox-sensitive bicupin YhaK (pirin superfamily)